MQLHNMEKLITALFLNKLHSKSKDLINSLRKYHILIQISVLFLQKHIYIQPEENKNFITLT